MRMAFLCYLMRKIAACLTEMCRCVPKTVEYTNLKKKIVEDLNMKCSAHLVNKKSEVSQNPAGNICSF